MQVDDTDGCSGNDDFYRDLQALADATFPKTCRSCKRVYATQAEFMATTMPVRNASMQQGSGLAALDPDNDASVSVFRNCTCGSTLMVDFQSRRDNSARGSQRRQLFDRMLVRLRQRGLSHDLARTELLRLLNGQPSAIISATPEAAHVAAMRQESGTAPRPATAP